MRISDWSSDVCSSDLCWGQPFQVTRPDSLQALRADVEQQVDGRHVWLECAVELGVGGVLVVVIDDLEDRKRGVGGKRVTVRGDLGGRRLIKKQTEDRLKYRARNMMIRNRGDER